MTAADTTHNYTIQSNTLTLSRTSGSPTIDVPSGRTLTISSVVAGSVGFTKTGDGTAALSGSNTLTGDVTVSAGLVTYGMNGNRTFSSLSGSGDFYRSSQNGTLSILDASTFTGNIATFNGGNSTHTIEFKSMSDAVGSGNLITRGGTGDSNQRTTFRLYGDVGPLTFDNRAIEILSKNPTPSNWSGRGTRLENNNATPANAWVINTDLINETDRNHEFEFRGSNTGDNEFAGAIGDSTGIGGLGAFYSTQTGVLSLIKDGAGKWIISGANTFTGGISIINGTLEVRGAGQLGSGGVYPGNITSTDTTPSPFTFDSSANTTISGSISGGMEFIKDGAGTLSLTGTAVHTGGTTVAAGTLSLGDGTNSASLSDFGTVSVATGAVVNLNYAGSDSVFFLNLGGSPAAAGTWGATGSGATNIDDTYFTGTGVINNLAGTTSALGIAFWDGGDVDIVDDGNAASAGGAGTWDTTIQNWDVGFTAHAPWLNTSTAKAVFAGGENANRTVTLTEAVNIKELSFETTGSAGTRYIIDGGTLNFGAGGVIRVADNRYDQTITSAITGSPAVETKDFGAGNTYKGLIFAPASGTQTLGAILNPNNTGTTDKAGLALAGSTTGNSVASIDYAGGDQYASTYLQSGEWSIPGGLRTGTLYVTGGTFTLGGTVKVDYNGLDATGGVIKGTFTFGADDRRTSLYMKNGSTISPGNSIGTVTVDWDNSQTPGAGENDYSLWFQNGSTYDWEVGAGNTTDTIHLVDGRLYVDGMTINIIDVGGSPSAGDQLPIFTYDTGVAIDLVGFADSFVLPAGWTGTPSLGHDTVNRIVYVTGISGAAPATPYDDWATANSLSGGQGDDEESDGLSNLLEFGFGTDPNAADNLPLLADGTRNGTPIVQASGGGGGVTFDFVFVRRDDQGTPGSVSYTAQFSNELSTWYNSGASPTFVADSTDDADYEVVKVPYPAMLPNGKKARFARLSVTPVN